MTVASMDRKEEATPVRENGRRLAPARDVTKLYFSRARRRAVVCVHVEVLDWDASLGLGRARRL